MKRRAFWGVCCQSGKKYSQEVNHKLRITMAVLDPAVADTSSSKNVSLRIEYDGNHIILCTLNKNTAPQANLDLMFEQGEKITFSLLGSGIVHLSGYYIHDETEKKPQDFKVSASPKKEDNAFAKKFSSEDEEEEDSNVDDSDEEKDELPTPKKHSPLKTSKSPSQSVTKSSIKKILDEESSEDESSEDESDEESEPTAVSKNIKRERMDIQEEKQNESTKKKLKFSVGLKDTPSLKKKNTKLKSADLNSSVGRTPRPVKKQKSSDSSGSDGEASQALSTSFTETSAGKKKKKNVNATPSSGKKMAGGLEYEDVRVGTGPFANRGKLVHVYYVGTLDSGKVFDRRPPSEKPFSFKLGSGQVIRGWDLGIEGMRVGGKRKLKIPPSLGYKHQAMGDIPPNSTLNFIVTLKAVS